jgi:hypothetical protein
LRGPNALLVAAISTVHLMLDQPRPKGDERAFTERSLFGVQAIERQLPTPIHHGRLNHFVVRDPGIGLQNQRQGQHRRGHRRLSLRRVFEDACQLDLKLRGEDLVTMAAQKEKEFGALNTLDDFIFRRRSLDRRLPSRWFHNRIAS